MNRLIVAFVAAVAVLGAFSAPPAVGEPYWIAWEGDTFPEEGEWNRAYGNYDGPGQGQAYRTLHDGVMTIDSLHDQGVYDYYWLERPGAIDPGPGELFVMEWSSLRVEEVDPENPIYPYDPGLGAYSDDAYGLGLTFSTDCFRSLYEHATWFIDLTTTHDFRVESFDMRSYSLLVDGELFYEGEFTSVVSDSRCLWGDDVQGVASLHDWDYFRFGVVPEPCPLVAVGMILVCCRDRRS